MKKIFLYLISLFIVNISLLASEPILVRQLEVTKGDSTFLHHFIYNVNNLKTIDTKYLKKGDDLIRLTQTEWIYSNGVCSEQRMRKWQKDNWQDIYLIVYNHVNGKKTDETHLTISDAVQTFVAKTKYIYSSEKIISKIDSHWVNNAWRQIQKINYTYTAENKTEKLNYFFYENGVVKEQKKIEYEYSASQNLLKNTVYVYKDDQWNSLSQTLYFYDENTNDNTFEVVKSWNEENNVWRNKENIQYKYDDNHKIVEENQQYWSGLFWKNDVKYNYYYNLEDFLISKETYLPVYNDYRLVSTVDYSEFLHDKPSLVESKYKFWGGGINQPVNTFIPFLFNDETVVENASKVKISYVPFDNTGVVTNSFSHSGVKIHVYPNPSRGVFYFSTDGFDVQNWIVRDLHGKILLQNSDPNQSGMIDLGDFKNGIYLLQVFTSEGVKSQKLIKM